jgi:molecular chaperone DnaK (HSP70)
MLVYDLGGGTFDVSVLMAAGNVFAPLNLEGDMWLGGDDLDNVLVDYAVKHLETEYGVQARANVRFMAELRKAAQLAKERLSSSNSTDLIVAGILQSSDGDLIDLDLEITRKDYERMILPLVGVYKDCACGEPNFPSADACAKCGKSLRNNPTRDGKTIRIVRKAIQNSNQTIDQIDYVLMAGNSTNVPIVQATMEELFGAKKLLRKVHPKHSVAMGAAIVAAWIGNRVVCQAPDPADAKRECGHVNDPDTTKCANCGAALGLVEQTAGADGNAPQIMFGDLRGGIAPFHYGTQSAGDKFNVFIPKGDPFPTETPQSQTFYTRMPNQRTVSVPVYGGDNTEKASANERQGEAIILLPPGLPQDTPVRVRLWLDGDGVFDLSANLADGSDLRPWIVHGETDARAIEGIQKVEEIFARKADAISPQAMRKLEEERDHVFDLMRKRDFDGAVSTVDKLQKLAEEAAAEPDDGDMRAQNIIGYMQFIMTEYAWAFEDRNYVYRMNKTIAEAREALDEKNHTKVNKMVAELEAESERLPEFVKIFIGVRGAIFARVQPTDPGTAAKLLDEMSEIEEMVKNNNPAAFQKLENLAQKIARAIEQAAARAPQGYACSKGHPSPGRFCPVCNEDTWMLMGRASSSSGEPRRH